MHSATIERESNKRPFFGTARPEGRRGDRYEVDGRRAEVQLSTQLPVNECLKNSSRRAVGHVVSIEVDACQNGIEG